ncbi:MAG: murein biosynthesis integral membrane protein MurJ [Pseudonocardiaceae bacterium]|nr:murein biosynthesis integral membrane protein MurJ [Pseudonocardiaceae bacterium]
MAVATLVSRISGFGKQLALAATLGFGFLYDSYLAANTLPIMLNELLIGGVLTSVLVPILVRAAREDADGGLRYTQRLVALITTLLLAATTIAILAAPLLVRLLQGNGQSANRELTTAFVYLLLPEIVFFGLGALFGAILNARGVFSPWAWAPVVNNIVVLLTLAAFWLVPGEITLSPVRMSDPKLLVLGIGTTLGIVLQVAVLLPFLRRVGFRFRWRWRIREWFQRDARLVSAARLMGWTTVYVLISQVGIVMTIRTAYTGDAGGVAIYNNAWLMLQLPYGVIGVSLLTVILPRMSRAAAAGDNDRLIGDLSLGGRYCAVLLVPVSVVFIVAGESIGIALFSYGAAEVSEARRLGLAIAVAAFGLLPYAITMLQLRVFYAMTDARTPALIMAAMVGVKVPLLLLCGAVLPDRQVVLGLTVINSFGFVIGLLAGQIWLRVRLGNLDGRRVSLVVAKTVVAGVCAALVAMSLHRVLVLPDGVPGAWAQLLLDTLIVGVVMTAVLVVLRTGELTDALRLIRTKVRGR